jgi:hypothetical protein
MAITYQIRDGLTVARVELAGMAGATLYPYGVGGVEDMMSLDLTGAYEFDVVLWMPSAGVGERNCQFGSEEANNNYYWYIYVDNELQVDAFSLGGIDVFELIPLGFVFDSWIWLKVEMDFLAKTLKVGIAENVVSPEEPTSWLVEYDGSSATDNFWPVAPGLIWTITDNLVDFRSFKITQIR